MLPRFSLTVALSLIILARDVTGQACAYPYNYKWTDKYYIFVHTSTPVRWFEGELHCLEKFCGHLASIQNQTQQNEFFNAKRSNETCWFGLI